MKKVLYICSRTGLTEPLGRSQVLPYILELSKNHKIFVISSEKNNYLKNCKNIRFILKNNQIIWNYSVFKFGKNSLLISLSRDILIGIIFCLRHKINVIHCRGYLSTLVGIVIKFFFHNELIFDMRGLWPEELALGLRKGKKSLIYKCLMFCEALSIFYSDKVISLTDRARYYLIKRYKINPQKIFTIPTCVDLKRFQYCSPKILNKKKMSCIGTILSDWFLVDWLSLFFNCVEQYDDDANYEIITNDNKENLLVKLNLNNSLRNKLNIISASPDEMPFLLKSHSASSFFFKSDISKLGSSPTRFGEILAVGRPVICNSGVGDLDKLVVDNNVGVVVDNLIYSSMMEGVKKLYKIIDDPTSSLKCRELAENYYSLLSGSRKYSQIYEK